MRVAPLVAIYARGRKKFGRISGFFRAAGSRSPAGIRWGVSQAAGARHETAPRELQRHQRHGGNPPLLSGREFDERDTNAARKTAIVNQRFARYFFGARSPLGRQVTSVREAYEIVGVVKDAKYQNLRSDAMRTMYIPWMQRGRTAIELHLSGTCRDSDPMRLAAALEKLVPEADPALRLRAAQTYSAVVDRSIVTERIMAALGGFFALLALVVACLGVFGVMAFQVSRRIMRLVCGWHWEPAQAVLWPLCCATWR
jgi:hypothetical protein